MIIQDVRGWCSRTNYRHIESRGWIKENAHDNVRLQKSVVPKISSLSGGKTGVDFKKHLPLQKENRGLFLIIDIQNNVLKVGKTLWQFNEGKISPTYQPNS